MTLASADVQKITFKKETRDAHLQKGRQGRLAGPRAAWRSKPITTEVEPARRQLRRPARSSASSRKRSGDPKKYQIPQKEVSLWVKGQDDAGQDPHRHGEPPRQHVLRPEGGRQARSSCSRARSKRRSTKSSSTSGRRTSSSSRRAT